VDEVAAVAESPEAGLPDGLGEDLGWLLGQVKHGYLTATVWALGDLPGGLKGLHVLGAAVEGAARNQIEVARRFSIDRTVMVRLVDDLERVGLVERHPDPTDRRARIISATDRGVAVHAATRERMRAVENHVLAPLDDDDRAEFLRLLRRVTTYLVGIDPTHAAAACAAAQDQVTALKCAQDDGRPC
jgi:DNA-binding MarR family transcriptional regulator